MKELLEEEEAALLSGGDESHLMEANEQQPSARPSTAPCSPGSVGLGESHSERQRENQTGLETSSDGLGG